MIEPRHGLYALTKPLCGLMDGMEIILGKKFLIAAFQNIRVGVSRKEFSSKALSSTLNLA